MQNIPGSFWLHPHPFVLASRSRIRRHMFEELGLAPVGAEAALDERSAEQGLRAEEISLHLAREKALAVSARHPGHVVLGADQTLLFEGAALHKPENYDQARRQLRLLSGKSHELRSSAALAQDGKILFSVTDTALLHMRDLSAEFIDFYLGQIGDAAFHSPGSYQVESRGLHLFQSIEGDHFTILGCPLLPVLDYLRNLGWVR